MDAWARRVRVGTEGEARRGQASAFGVGQMWGVIKSGDEQQG